MFEICRGDQTKESQVWVDDRKSSLMAIENISFWTANSFIQNLSSNLRSNFFIVYDLKNNIREV